MQNIKQHIVLRILSLMLAVAVVLPSVVKFAHVFESHEHEVCSNKATAHFHNVDNDCELHKFKINNPIDYTVQNFELFSSEKFSETIISQYHFVSHFQRLPFSLRGPPVLV